MHAACAHRIHQSGPASRLLLVPKQPRRLSGPVLSVPRALRLLCAQVISLGTHVICADWPKSMMLFEVMPSVLSKRTFPPLATERMLVPGYRDSPDPSQDMAIVYVKVAVWDWLPPPLLFACPR